MKYVCALVLVAMLVAGCGSPKVINGKQYETYGLLNADNVKDPNIRYEPSLGNIIWGIALIGTIAAPVYFFGFSLFNPVGHK